MVIPILHPLFWRWKQCFRLQSFLLVAIFIVFIKLIVIWPCIWIIVKKKYFHKHLLSSKLNIFFWPFLFSVLCFKNLIYLFYFFTCVCIELKSWIKNLLISGSIVLVSEVVLNKPWGNNVLVDVWFLSLLIIRVQTCHFSDRLCLSVPL